MEKTIICSYWENKTCKFMEDPFMCQFAHGTEDINKIYCKYGNHCNNPKCAFYHGNESTTPDMVYDIPIIDKRKNKKNKKIIKNTEKYNKSINFDNLEKEEIIPFTNYIPHTYERQETATVVKIINKEYGIKENINIFNNDHVKVLSIIDDFYITKYNNIVNEKNRYIRQIVFNNYKNIYYLRKINNNKDEIINKLKSENILLKENNELLKKEKNIYTKNNMVDINNNKKIYKIDFQNKLKTLYNKYINLYEIFKRYENYKLINLDEIKKYTKDKNIYKIKQRATKVFNFFEKFKKGHINDLLPVSTIFKMVF